jgi:hypothetical protein
LENCRAAHRLCWIARDVNSQEGFEPFAIVGGEVREEVQPATLGNRIESSTLPNELGKRAGLHDRRAVRRSRTRRAVPLQLLLLPTDPPLLPDEKPLDLAAAAPPTFDEVLEDAASTEAPLFVVAAVPDPEPPARPLTARDKPTTRDAGGAGELEMVEPSTLVPEAVRAGGS